MSVHAPHALLVCHDGDNRADLVATLSQCGVRAVASPTIAEAHLLLKLHSFDLVFCEDKLGDGDYRDVLSALTFTRSQPPLVVCSPRGDLDRYLDAMQDGAFDFIVPPYRYGDLAPIVRSVQVYLNQTNIARTAVAGEEADPQQTR